MSRKDTIIIALLINAGLLALLFMLAINTDDDTVADHPEISQALAENRPLKQPQNSAAQREIGTVNMPSTTDEVDNFLKDLSADDTSQAIVIDEDGYVEFVKQPENIVKKEPIPEAQPVDNTQYVQITVKRGDVLEKIARSNGISVEALKNANQMTTNKLSIGQVLKVPVSKNGTGAAPSAAKTPVATNNTPKTPPAPKAVDAAPSVEPEYYILKSGDSPWKIAKQNNVNFEDLLKLNGLNEEKARNLKVGDKIRVR